MFAISAYYAIIINSKGRLSIIICGNSLISTYGKIIYQGIDQLLSCHTSIDILPDLQLSKELSHYGYI